MIPNGDELREAMRWLHKCSKEQTSALFKAMRSLDKIGVDGNQLLIACYRNYGPNGRIVKKHFQNVVK